MGISFCSVVVVMGFETLDDLKMRFKGEFSSTLDDNQEGFELADFYVNY